MIVIGYRKARDLMRQHDWKMLVTMRCYIIKEIVLYHPKEPTQYKVRLKNGRKLIQECRVIGSKDYRTAILCYDWDSSGESLV